MPLVRRLILLLLIALVPLRAIGADVMVVTMFEQSRQHPASSSEMPADCPVLGHGSAGADEPDDGTSAPAGCLTCHFFLGAPPVPLRADEREASAPPAIHAVRFASALTAPEQRPPIP
jgi:hypothetical protein